MCSVKKEGKNKVGLRMSLIIDAYIYKGRLFYACPKPRGKQCKNFFVWKEKAQVTNHPEFWFLSAVRPRDLGHEPSFVSDKSLTRT